MISGRAMRALAVVLCGLALVGPAGAQPADEPTLTVPVAPVRILDTRTGVGTGGLTTPIGPNGEIELSVAGVESVPANAVGVVLNVTATEGTEPSFLTVYPAGTGRPDASVLNVAPGSNLPNMITAKLGDGGRLRIYNLAGTVHVLADVAGYLIPSGQIGGVPGPQGPAGPAGPAGAPGSPGTATAWGRVNGSGSPPTLVFGSPNVAGVSRVTGNPLGVWCISFTAPIPINQRRTAAIGHVAGTDVVLFNGTDGIESGCPGGLRVGALTPPMTPVDAQFSFVVP